jgi:hypothetical protein
MRVADTLRPDRSRSVEESFRQLFNNPGLIGLNYSVLGLTVTQRDYLARLFTFEMKRPDSERGDPALKSFRAVPLTICRELWR